MSEKIAILMVASEVAPFAKTGGLADVVGSLPKALQRLNVDVRIIMPRYKTIDPHKYKLKRRLEDITIKMGDYSYHGDLLEGKLNDKVPIYLVENKQFYDRDNLYSTPGGDYPDNLERFTFLNRFAMQVLDKIDFVPDIIHCHDWQSGLIPAYIKKLYKNDKNFGGIKTIFTIHNIAYQGNFPSEKLPITGLPWEVYNMNEVEFYGRFSLIKSGIVYSDAITTVSEGYSREIQTAEYGYGLEGILSHRKDRLYGIINGVDYEQWNPRTDDLIAKNYDLDDLEGKKECKRDLLREFNIEPNFGGPVLGMITRLADQKGLDLVAQIIPHLLRKKVVFVLLGTGEEKYHILFENLARRYPKKTGISIAYDNSMAHKIEAGADMFLMPSRYEPCGLNQMYSLRYGTIPIVRATGGLDDTIVEFDPKTGQGNGFKFHRYDAGDFLAAINRAMEQYRRKRTWDKLIENAMRCDFSWDASAKKYLRLYKRLLGITTG